VNVLCPYGKDDKRTAAAIKAGLDNMLGTMAGQGFDMTTIYSDGEGAIGKLKYHMNRLGIELNISGVGGHVPRIEREVLMVKERAIAYFNGRLPFTLTALGVALLVLFIVSRLNFQKSGVTGGCPREEFTGRRVDGSRDFRASFGDYVVCTVLDTKNNMESRVTDGYVVLPTGDRTGSVKVCNIATQKIITRDQFTNCPMPDASTVRHLQRVASSRPRIFMSLMNSLTVVN
jgi:hypothetical protein